MTARYSLGVDVGTTSVKVCAVDEAGAVVATASSHHGIDESGEGVQVAAERWWDSLLTALAALPIDLADVATIGFSGNMSSVVLVDGENAALAPAMLLADARGAEQLAELSDEVTAEIVTRTGNVPETVFSLASLLWLRDTRPDLLEAAAAWLSSKDYLRARLTGVRATDPTDAYNSLLMRDAEWSPDLIEAVGLPVHIFPPLIGSGEWAGTVTDEAAALTGLPVGIPVAAGSGDVAAAITGAGGLGADALAVSLGTSATVMASVPDRRLPDAALGSLTVHPSAEGTYFALGSLLTGGLALNWLRGIVGPEAIAAASAEPAGGEVVFLPYLAGTGSPDFVPTARGTLFGITPATTAEEIVAALLEAIAFDIAGLIERVGMDYSAILVSGGGSHIAAWPQILADVTGIPVDRLDAPDLSAIGAAVLGWRAAGNEVAAAGRTERVHPRPDTAERWAVRRARYEAARTSALDLYTNPPIRTIGK